MTPKTSHSNMNTDPSTKMLLDTSTKVNIHSRNEGHQQSPATTIEIEMPGPDSDTANGRSPKEKDEQLQERQEVREREKEDEVEGGNDMCAVTNDTSRDSPDLRTSQEKHIVFAMDEFSAPNNSHN